MSNLSGLMLEPQQLATTLRLLIVADKIADAVPIANALTAAKITFDSEVAATQEIYLSLLHNNTYDAVLFNSCPQPQFAPHTALRLLSQCGQNIPVILIAPTLDDKQVSTYRRAGITDCLATERIFMLPELLVQSLSRTKHQPSSHLQLLPSPSPKKVSLTAARIIKQMWEKPSLSDRLQWAANALHEALGVSRCLVFLDDPSSQMVVRYVSEATTGKDDFLGAECKAANHYHGLLSQGIPVMISIVDEQTPDVMKAIAQTWEFQAVLAMPLLYQQTYWGILGLYHCDRAHQWTEAELNLVRVVTDQCALALNQSHLEKQCQQQQQQTQLLARLGQILNSDLEGEALLQEMVEGIGQGFEVERVLFLNLEEDMVVAKQEWRDRPEIPSVLGAKIPASEWQGLQSSSSDYQTHGYLQAPYYAQCCVGSPQLSKLLERSQTRSLLSVPIVLRGTLIGFLNLQMTSRSRHFSSEEIETLRSTANFLALALAATQQRDRLEEKIAQRTQALEAAKQHSEAENQAKSELLSTMSHELRTPLTSIIGFSRMLIDRCYGELNDKQQQYVSAIASSGEHLLALINDLLDISKIEANKEELYLETLAVEEISLASLSILQERAVQAGLELKLEIHPEIAVCTADRRRLKQILVNLLSNAVKFTENGSVTLRIQPMSEMLEFAVIDTGIGMSEGDLRDLFQPFHQIKTHLHRKHKGTGLGLALSRKLARLHNGDLTVTSEEGQGTCFALHLPMTNPMTE